MHRYKDAGRGNELNPLLFGVYDVSTNERVLQESGKTNTFVTYVTIGPRSEQPGGELGGLIKLPQYSS